MALRDAHHLAALPDAMHVARSDLGWSQETFWLAYKQAGGEMGFEAFKDYLRGDSTPNVYEYDVMARVLNEALKEDRLPRLPFDPPRPRAEWVARESNPEPTDYITVVPSIAA